MAKHGEAMNSSFLGCCSVTQQLPALRCPGVALAEQLQGHVKEAFASPHANHVLQCLVTFWPFGSGELAVNDW